MTGWTVKTFRDEARGGVVVQEWLKVGGVTTLEVETFLPDRTMRCVVGLGFVIRRTREVRDL